MPGVSLLCLIPKGWLAPDILAVIQFLRRPPSFLVTQQTAG